MSGINKGAFNNESISHRITAALAGAFMSKTCDLVAGSYCFSGEWGVDEQPLMVRRRIEAQAEMASALEGPGSEAADGADPAASDPVGYEIDKGRPAGETEAEREGGETETEGSGGQAPVWTPWQRATSKGGVVRLDEADSTEEVQWERNYNLDVEV